MPEASGALLANLAHFVRVLRQMGVTAGPGRTLDAVRAVQAVDIGDRAQVFWALHASLVDRHEHFELFRQAFRLFWRDPRRLPDATAELLRGLRRPPAPPLRRRLAEAFWNQARNTPRPAERPPQPMRLAYSSAEALRTTDFASMSSEEWREARKAIAALRWAFAEVPTRRLAPDPRGERVDPRASFRAGLRGGGEMLPRWRRRRTRPPPLVVLCDVSGSMEAYARPLLLFLHAVAAARPDVHAFLFGTRLSNITRQLRQRDADAALQAVSRAVPDWAGGTRLATSVARFNRDWARRVLGAGAVVLVVTDGLDREPGDRLDPELARLRRGCRRLLWLNPLLRWSGYQAEAEGARVLARHVDETRPVHDLASLAALARALSGKPGLR